MDVVIDDKLPTINGRLIFVHSKDPNEFWPALLEKAYAKYAKKYMIYPIYSEQVTCGGSVKILSTSVRVCGSYTDMTSGTPSEAMMDFTGGIHMCVQLSDASSDVWGLICRAGKSNTLMGCGTPQGVSTKKQNSETPRGYSGRLFSNYKKGLRGL